MKITEIRSIDETGEPVDLVDDNETSSPVAELPVAELPAARPELIEVSLSIGIATFRIPTAIDLDLVEKEVGGVNSADFSIGFYRQLAVNTCLSYGSSNGMPADPDLIKGKDDNKICLALIEAFRAASIPANDSDSYAILKPNGSAKAGFDAVEITLSNGDKLVLDEPSMKENQAREAAETNVGGILIIASTLCRSWGGESLSIAEYRIKLNRLAFDDFFRVSSGLAFFR